MIGLLGLILVHAKNLSNYVKENIVLNVIVSDGAKEVDVLAYQKQLDAHPYILSTQYVSKEIAARNLQKDLGEEFVEFLGYNPLLSSIDIYMKAEHANNASIQSLSNQLTKNPMVKEVIYQKSLIDMVNQNINIIGLIILGFACVLLIISVALINNTIRLSIYSQRFLIKSMQLVGATKNFIRKPFITYGVLHGLLGALIAIILLLTTLYLAQHQIPELVVLKSWGEFALVFAGVLILGIMISLFSTYFAVSKYLRSKIYDLYR
jgi:cell division transport system permease protein